MPISLTRELFEPLVRELPWGYQLESLMVDSTGTYYLLAEKHAEMRGDPWKLYIGGYEKLKEHKPILVESMLGVTHIIFQRNKRKEEIVLQKGLPNAYLNNQNVLQRIIR